MNRTLRLATLSAALLTTGCSQYVRQALTTEPSPTVRQPSADVVSFCGPDPTAPHWRRQLATLADIGVTAVHGPCRTPPADYSVLAPGHRYASQAEYLTLAAEARLLGVGVIVFDPTFWTDPTAAAAVWGGYIADGTVVAADLGDEPGWADMAELNRRAQLVRTAGVEPQVIFFNGRLQNVIEQHRALPTVCPTSDDYEHNGDALNDAAMLQFEAGCAGIAVDTTGRDLDGDGDRWSVAQIDRAQASGYRITLFTGVRPDNFPTWDALVDNLGRPTAAGLIVKEALK